MNNNFKPTANIPDFPMEEKIPNVEPLSAIMGRANNLSKEALLMAYRINAHLFGKGEPQNEESCEPRCYRDVMEMHTINLEKLCKELSQIMQYIGV